MVTKPEKKPERPTFSSGPCAKYPTFAVEKLAKTPVGRSHRSDVGKGKLKKAIDKSKEILQLPDDYRVGIVPASDTGAVEMALWNFLGQRGVDVVAFESFGQTWANDIQNELKIEDVRVFTADYGELPDLSRVDFSNDVVFTWNGTTSGVKIPDGNWIPDDREGLTICDATSAVFAMDIPWDKIDVATYSWQKVMGGEAAHGMLILSPAAVERAKNYTPPRSLPKIFRLFKGGSFNEGLFEGSTINTPSLLCTQDYLEALSWAESIGGLEGLKTRSQKNLSEIKKFVDQTDGFEFLVKDPQIRSNTSVTLELDLSEEKISEMVELLAQNEAAYDIASYRKAPPGLRIWCGATVDSDDVAILCEWLEWGYEQVK
ncbi:MAG: phosphoserine transaminase [Halanaerobiaceae bacterium]